MANVCSSQSPWKNTNAEVVRAALWLANNDIDIASLDDDTVLSMYASERHPILPDVHGLGDGQVSIRAQGERK